ncbi:MAG TPA: TonB-dependent receptor [Gemmatimonadales bacterium]|nr:TonB-dependent receptor [Gemmatimonadales bacterium]
MNVVLLALVLLQQPQDTVVLNPVVVTATRVPMPADEVSSAVTVLRGRDLVAAGIRTVADALQQVPGATLVETGSFGGQTSLFMRGGESDYVKVLLDGVPLNQAGGGIDLANLTTDNVDRIEILRGPASVLYGSDAMTGVVQIFTKTGAASRTRVGAELRAGTYGSSDAALDATGGTATLSYSARISRFFSGGLYPYNNQYRNSVISAGLQFVPDARSDVHLTYRYGDDIYHIPTDATGAPVDSNQRAAERGPQLSVNGGHRFGNQLEARVMGAVREARMTFNDEPDSPGEDGTSWSRDYVRRASATSLVTWRSHGAITLTGGIEYEDERQRGTSEFSASFGTFPDSIQVQRHNTGYFTQGLITAGRAALTVGGRLDDNSQFGTHATYRAGVVYRLLEQTRVRVSGGTGFKEPTFFENYAHGFVLGNPDLHPERSGSWEAGIEQRFAANRAAITVTYFSQRFRDLIEYNPAPPAGQPNYFNVGGAIANGVETTVSANPSPAVAFQLRYTYLHTRVEQSGAPNDPDGLFVPGKTLIRRPGHQVAPDVTATAGRTHVSLGLTWVGKRDDLDFNRPVGQRRVTLDPYTRVNVAAEYDLGRVVLSARVENLFDDQTQEIAGFKPRGRTVLVGGRFSVGL